MKEYEILNTAAAHAFEYLEEISERRVFPAEESIRKLENFSFPLPDVATDAKDVIDLMHRLGSENTVVTNGGRYFGFVFGGSLPASLAANWIASAWDQNAVFRVTSPVAAQIEKVAATWLLDLLRFPPTSAVGFVTGTTMANFSSVIAARYHIYKKIGWD